MFPPLSLVFSRSDHAPGRPTTEYENRPSVGRECRRGTLRACATSLLVWRHALQRADTCGTPGLSSVRASRYTSPLRQTDVRESVAIPQAIIGTSANRQGTPSVQKFHV